MNCLPTIKDIAKAAGVSQGTVSNVLNQKGNVSAEKIKLVKKAAEKLGYTINSGAKSLRKGNSNIVGVLLPNINNRQYIDFYQSFNRYAEANGFTVKLYFNDDNPSIEADLIKTMKSDLCEGVAVFSSLGNESYNLYQKAGFKNDSVVYVERKPDFPCTYVGFDYRKCGEQFAQDLIDKKYKNYLIVLENSFFSSQREFVEGFRTKLGEEELKKNIITMDTGNIHGVFLKLLEGKKDLEAVYFSNYSMARIFCDIADAFFRKRKIDIICISPLFIMPIINIRKYELNYRLLGKTSCETLLKNIRSDTVIDCETILQNDGFRNWHVNTAPPGNNRVKLLTLDSPTARIISIVSRLFTENTGIKVEVDVRQYDDIFKILSNLNDEYDYDAIRLDHTWLSWFGRDIYTPMEEIDSSVVADLDRFLPSLKNNFSIIDNKVYAFPETPSSQLLFYRKDLFENPILKRQYWEKYKKELKPPEDFDNYNAIARFFTKSLNPDSPILYGSSLTLGNTGVAGTEFLARYFSLSTTLFNNQGKLHLDPDLIHKVLSLIVEIKQCAPPKPSLWWTQTAREFAEGETAMTILFTNFASDMFGPDSKIVGKAGFTTVPGGNPVLGGGSIGVSKYSRNKQQALSFIRWLCSNEVATLNTYLGGVSPCQNTYDNYEVVDKYPWLPLSRRSIEVSKTERTPNLYRACFNERAFLDIIGTAVIDCAMKNCDIKDVVARTMQQLSTKNLVVIK